MDEPANNLDLVGIGQPESSLEAYQGAFVVLSHHERVVAGVGVRRWPRLSEGRLSPVAAPDPA